MARSADSRVSHWLVVLLAARQVHSLFDPVHKIESARLYGNIDEYAYYFVDLIIGTPPQRVSVILDTGSGVCAFPCANCNHCGKHIDPAFDFAHSSTANWQKCGNECRGTCTGNHCAYHQGYTEGSSISGYWFNDFVRLGDAIQRNPPVLARMGCHNNENKLFYTQKANGILGIGRNGRGGRTILQEIFEDHAHVEGSIFSICLAEWGGRLTVGGHNASYHTGQIQYMPLISRSGYYGVPLSSMRLDGKTISTSFGTAMIDSGTTYTYMGAAPYNALKTAIESWCREHANCGSRQAGKCWTVASVEALDKFPTIQVSFKDMQTVWVPKAYLYRKGTSQSWCYAFKNDGAGANTVLGASWMIHQELIFDLHGNRVGVAPANCPEYRNRPRHQIDLLDASSTREPLVTSTAPITTTTAAPTTTTVVTTTAAATTTTVEAASTTTTMLVTTSIVTDIVTTITSTLTDAVTTITSIVATTTAMEPATTSTPVPMQQQRPAHSVGHHAAAADAAAAGHDITPILATTTIATAIVATTTTAAAPNSGRFSSARPASEQPAVLLGLAGGGLVLSLGLCAFLASRGGKLARTPRAYAQQQDEDEEEAVGSNMPPQIVGAEQEEHEESDFAIDEIDNYGEEDRMVISALGSPSVGDARHPKEGANSHVRYGDRGAAHANVDGLDSPTSSQEDRPLD